LKHLLGFILTLEKKLNYYGKLKIPIFFVISFDMKDFDIIPLDNLPKDIIYTIDDINIKKNSTYLNIVKTSYKEYEKQFLNVINNIKKGNTYIFNLTNETKISNNISLKNIYESCNAKYKLYYKNKFLSFSPETFVKISSNKIYSFPMKGTIDAKIKNAKNKILNNKKELAEHTMIVDLIRNDLSIYASDVNVDKFRYIEKIKAGNKDLYQVSSKISAQLPNNWNENIGDILCSLLPAGSITGTPKRSTVNLIKKIENYNRDFFTGIWGVYDGENIDTSVLIRFIQNNNGSYVYKSGGGITIDSDCLSEYNEMNDKIYIP